jgi:hypothetical protein
MTFELKSAPRVEYDHTGRVIEAREVLKRAFGSIEALKPLHPRYAAAKAKCDAILQDRSESIESARAKLHARYSADMRKLNAILRPRYAEARRKCNAFIAEWARIDDPDLIP